MEKITRKPLSEIPSLKVLLDNWEQWGKEYKARMDAAPNQSSRFTWRGRVDRPLRVELDTLTRGHCNFCDGLLGPQSTETIEHYKPKTDFPLEAYDWPNLYFCCNACQSEANKRPFAETLRPDNADYEFDRYFYFDRQTGEVKVMENLEEPDFTRADGFLKRYGISSNPKRNKSRQNEFMNIKNYLLERAEDGRVRDDFPYRFVFDYALFLSR